MHTSTCHIYLCLFISFVFFQLDVNSRRVWILSICFTAESLVPGTAGCQIVWLNQWMSGINEWIWKPNRSACPVLMNGISFHPLLMFSHCRVRLFATPWTAARQASLFLAISWSLPKFMSIESVMQSNHLIFCCPLLFCLRSFPTSGFFPNESAVRIICCRSQNLGVTSNFSLFFILHRINLYVLFIPKELVNPSTLSLESLLLILESIVEISSWSLSPVFPSCNILMTPQPE